ncbi:type III secretion system (T3SS) protein HpaP [Chelatococcus asaccharovorans]|uniref:Type III secretion system (T3SS) protein HpaP n=1 Tax=Chelatococcus asaccharovorans TaxID=28210 RepID=A0A2V3TZF5_9HYPH|nr:type III secretion system (T3SS) protein HpaP [Chelatococcus asaccharovorans]
MRSAARTEDRFSRWGLAGSVLLHILMGVFILLLPTAPKLPEQPEQAVEVEIVILPPPQTEQQEKSARQPDLPPTRQDEGVPADKPGATLKTPAVPEAVPPEVRPHDETPAMVKPSRMLSEEVLANPRSRKAKEELATLAPAERIEQLCGLEAMAQVGAWSEDLKPDRVVAYAMADPKLSGNSLSADGAALHSKQDWYRLRFKCVLSSDHKKVAAFEFLMGEPIPKKDWEENNLPSEGKSLD